METPGENCNQDPEVLKTQPQNVYTAAIDVDLLEQRLGELASRDALDQPDDDLLVVVAHSLINPVTGCQVGLEHLGLGVGLLGVVWGLVNGNADGWGSPTIVTALAAGIVFLVAFVAWELRQPAPRRPGGYTERTAAP